MDDLAPRQAAIPPVEQLAAMLDWWRAAGVDCAFVDEPVDWLAPPPDKQPKPAAAVPVPEEPAAPPLGGNRAAWPADLAAFREWWLAEPTLDPAPLAARVPPRGSKGAALMVLVPMPEAEDTDTLLSARQGRLVAGIARAMGVTQDDLYLASALPRCMALPDWQALRSADYGAILLHHIALASPQRLLVLGAADILPLLGHDPAQASPGIHPLSADGLDRPLLAGFAPDALLARWQARAQLWRLLLDWTDPNA